MKKTKLYEHNSKLLFLIIIVFLTRQVPLSSYSYIMNISLILLFVVSYEDILRSLGKDKIVMLVVFATFCVLVLMIFYSLFLGNKASLIIRFFLILSLIVLAYFVKPNSKYIDIFLIFITIQAVVVIGLEITLVIYFDEKSYNFIRYFFLNRNWGDVYTTSGRWWKIQLRGNVLLPFAFFVSIIYQKDNKRKIYASIFLFAIICAGNFAFILGVLLFIYLYYIYSNRWNIQKIVLNGLFLLILLPFISIPIYSYLSDIMVMKSVRSNPIRIDQAKVLVSNMNGSIFSIVFGKGLGNLVDAKTQWRDYSNYIYYELQGLYVLNQVGLLFSIFFILLNMILAKYSMKYTILLVAYGNYVFYALFNPYFLDTNHIVVIVVLLSLRKVLDEKNLLNTRSI